MEKLVREPIFKVSEDLLVIGKETAQEFCCIICLQFSNKPLILTCCEHVICEDCFENLAKDSKSCPIDRKVNPQAQKLSIGFSRIYGEYKFLCPNNKSGCEEANLTMSGLKDHLSFCLFKEAKETDKGENTREELEEIIKELAASNNEIIIKINKLIQSGHSVKNMIFKVDLELDEGIKHFFKLEHEEDTVQIKELIDNWRVPLFASKPKVADPDCILNWKEDDVSSLKCENFQDLIKWNKQDSIAYRYLNVLRKSAAIKFGKIFAENFKTVNNLLMMIKVYAEREGINENMAADIQMQKINNELRSLYAMDGFRIRYFPEFIKETEILNLEMLKHLERMLPKKIFSAKKILDSSRGMAATTFDAAVRGKGQTLIIIQNTANYVFGAYVEDIWGSPGGWIKGSLETFLFTFGNVSNGKVSPIKLLHNGIGNGIHITSCGVHLGSDLVTFCSNTSTPSVYNKIAPGYPVVNVDSSLLAGASSWTPSKIDVLELTFK